MKMQIYFLGLIGFIAIGLIKGVISHRKEIKQKTKVIK